MSSPYGYDDDDGDIDWVFGPVTAVHDTSPAQYLDEGPFVSSSPAHAEWDRPSIDIDNLQSAPESAGNNPSQRPPEPASPDRPQQRSPSFDSFLRHIEAEQRERSRDRQALLRNYRAAREALRDRRARLAALQAAFTIEPEAELDFHQTDDDDDFDPLDELFEMEVNEAPRNPLRRRRQPQPSPPPALPEAQRSQQRDPTVIDLTEEPDSPVLTFPPLALPRSNPPSHSQPGMHRNPRRQMSLNHRTPSLARSDGSLLGANQAIAVIDLTEEPDEPGPRAAREPRSRRRAREEHHQNRFPAEVSFFAQLSAIRQRFNDALPHIFGAHQPIDAEVQFIGQNHANMNPLANNPVRFNYRANGFGGFDGGRQPSPKPAHVPPPAPREGFTRDTGEDLAFVCPSCDDELKYDSDDDEEEQRPAKKARTAARSSKATEEHHFWAVKNCGHVYCRKCFENRRGGPKTTWYTAFSRDDVKNPKTFCAVDGCGSDVTRKEAWVGIFL